MAAPATDAPAPPLAPSGWLPWLRWFALCLAIGSAWAMAVPRLAGPDEQTHVTKAAAVVRGELDGRVETTVLGDVTMVEVPEIFSGVPARPAKGCFSGFPAIPASCARRVRGGTTTVDAGTYVGAYPPAYYAVVGLPTRALVRPIALDAMRAIAVLLGSALLASAFASASVAGQRDRRLLGVVLATTPMVWFLVAVVNPNGIEVAGALLAVTAVLALGRAGPEHHARLVRRAVIGFAACTLVRTPSLAFAVLAVAVGWLALGDERPPLRSLPGIRPALGAIAATIVLAVAWSATHSTGAAGEAIKQESVMTSIGETGRFLRQAIGDFGELDTPLPGLLWGAWAALVAGFSILGLVLGSLQQRAAIVLAALAAVTIPVVAQALAIQPVGANWQGRYGLPALVLVPALAGTVVPRRRRHPEVLALLGVVVVVQVGALLTLLRRYQVGVDGPLWFFGTGTWRSPVELGLVVLLALAGWSALALEVARDGRSPVDEPLDDPIEA